jgi:hypothetical protein
VSLLRIAPNRDQLVRSLLRIVNARSHHSERALRPPLRFCYNLAHFRITGDYPALRAKQNPMLLSPEYQFVDAIRAVEDDYSIGHGAPPFDVSYWDAGRLFVVHILPHLGPAPYEHAVEYIRASGLPEVASMALQLDLEGAVMCVTRANLERLAYWATRAVMAGLRTPREKGPTTRCPLLRWPADETRDVARQK